MLLLRDSLARLSVPIESRMISSARSADATVLFRTNHSPGSPGRDSQLTEYWLTPTTQTSFPRGSAVVEPENRSTSSYRDRLLEETLPRLLNQDRLSVQHYTQDVEPAESDRETWSLRSIRRDIGLTFLLKVAKD